MLRLIVIHNFALIDHLEVEFQPGFNLITGETGSGKSILVDAVGQLVGARASQEMVRQGHDSAWIEGLFELKPDHPVIPLLDEGGYSLDGSQLIIRREITRTGTNRIFLNGRLATQNFLAGLGSLLVDIHGQHTQQALLQPSNHLDFLDDYGDNRLFLSNLKTFFSSLCELRNRYSNLQRSEKDRLQRLDLLRYQLSEIERLKLSPGLDEELESESRLLASAEKRLQTAQEVYNTLYEEENSLLSVLDHVEKRIADLCQLDSSFAGVEERIREIRFQLEEVSFQARDYASGIESDSRRLEEIEERLAEIAKAKRKYGTSVDAILAFAEQAAQEIEQLDHQEAEGEQIGKQLAKLEKECLEVAQKLSEKRIQDARKLGVAVERELADLAMKKTIFQVELLRALEGLSEKGIDRAEFLISPNPGEAPRPLAKIASGGELSRVMLAIKSVLKTDGGGPKTLVFDEVDAGIGGATAAVLGEKLRCLSSRHQVFCVTHLPQIAALANQHFHVGKVPRENRTVVDIRPLDEAARVEELARMLAGDAATETTRQQSREMLARRAPVQPR